jgi:hypothetical protein
MPNLALAQRALSKTPMFNEIAPSVSDQIDWGVPGDFECPTRTGSAKHLVPLTAYHLAKCAYTLFVI